MPRFQPAGTASSPAIDRIARIRTRILATYGFVAALASGAYAAWSANAIAHGSIQAFPLWPVVLQTAIALIAALLALLVHRIWASRLLVVSFAVLPTLMVMHHGFPHEVALTSYMAMLLASAVGGLPIDTGITTVTAVGLSLLISSSHSRDGMAMAVLFSTSALLLSTGAALTWLQFTLYRTILGLDASQAHFQKLSHIDSLTGLGNRRLFDLMLKQALKQASPEKPLALILLDLDNLKQLNDLHTHPVGDEALRQLGHVIRSSTRGTDIAMRIGGDEFAVILPSGGLPGAQHVLERIERKLDETSIGGELQIRLTASLGLAVAESPETTPQQLHAEADAKMYTYRRRKNRPSTQA